MKDLWPTDIAEGVNRAPVTILNEQAALLGEKTQNIVKAEVKQIQDEQSPYDFNYRFYIVAPALQNYRYKLFDISHDIALYPLQVYLDTDIALEIHGVPAPLQIENEDEFLAVLGRIFASKKTRRVVASILGQSTDKYSANVEDGEDSSLPF